MVTIAGKTIRLSEPQVVDGNPLLGAALNAFADSIEQKDTGLYSKMEGFVQTVISQNKTGDPHLAPKILQLFFSKPNKIYYAKCKDIALNSWEIHDAVTVPYDFDENRYDAKRHIATYFDQSQIPASKQVEESEGGYDYWNGKFESISSSWWSTIGFHASQNLNHQIINIVPPNIKEFMSECLSSGYCTEWLIACDYYADREHERVGWHKDAEAPNALVFVGLIWLSGHSDGNIVSNLKGTEWRYTHADSHQTSLAPQENVELSFRFPILGRQKIEATYPTELYTQLYQSLLNKTEGNDPAGQYKIEQAELNGKTWPVSLFFCDQMIKHSTPGTASRHTPPWMLGIGAMVHFLLTKQSSLHTPNIFIDIYHALIPLSIRENLLKNLEIEFVVKKYFESYPCLPGKQQEYLSILNFLSTSTPSSVIRLNRISSWQFIKKMFDKLGVDVFIQQYQKGNLQLHRDVSGTGGNIMSTILEAYNALSTPLGIAIITAATATFRYRSSYGSVSSP